MKGIILAGGSGTRLWPLTKTVSKQLMPIYDKPMIYYPLSTLMLAGIRDILIITTPSQQKDFINQLGDGSQFGINLSYVVQPSPDGLAQAFILGKDFIGDDECAMILGDNIFYGEGFVEKLNNARISAENGKSTIFCIKVTDPERFGIAEIGENNKVLSIEEKPKFPKSDYCVTGLYFYKKGVTKKALEVKPSARGELEITSLNNMYLEDGDLVAELLRKSFHWMDTGTFASLHEASNFVEGEEERLKELICCPEQIGYQKGWLSKEKLIETGKLLSKNTYGQFLLKVSEKDEIINETGKVLVRK